MEVGDNGPATLERTIATLSSTMRWNSAAVGTGGGRDFLWHDLERTDLHVHTLLE